MISLTSILYPTDFSDNAKQALPYVREMLERFQAQLHLLHVLESTVQPADLSWSVSPPDVEAKLQKTARGRLEKLAEGFEMPAERITLAVARGHPSLEITRYAKDHEISMIVMSTHGHSGLSHFLLGSVTERVVRKSPCPVLTIKANHEPDGEEPDEA